MNELVEIPDFLRDYENEFESEFNRRMAELYAQLKTRRSWIRNLFRTVCQNEADIDGMVHETFCKYLQDVGTALWVTEGVSVLTDTIAIDGVPIAVTLSGVPAKPIRDIEKYTYVYPDAVFGKIARNVRTDYGRKLAGERKQIRTFGFIESLYHYPRSIEQRLVLECRVRDIHERYVIALKKLGRVQRAAWILCKDELLTAKEAECLLAPMLHWRTTRAKFGLMPMEDVAAADLLDRAHISSDVSKAKSKLADQLADMNPCKAWDLPAQKLSREFLASFRRFGSTRFLRPWIYSTPEDKGISDSDKSFLYRMPARYLSRSAAGPVEERGYDVFWRHREMANTKSYCQFASGWYAAPEPDDPEYVSLLSKIRELRKARKSWKTIAEVLNNAGIPSRFGPMWHPSAVRLTALRAQLLKIRPIAQSR